METNTLLILYAEIMPYNVATFNALVNNYKNYHLHVVCWGADKKLTKYQQPNNDKITYYDKSKLKYSDILSIYKTIEPKVLLVSGRMEKDYLKLALIARKDSKIVVGTADNHYNGSLKQKLAIFFSNFLYKRYFEFMLVPGIFQYEYQRLLGFKREKILFPQYCADTLLFEQAYNNSTTDKKGILFLGRLHTVKGIDMLIKVHKELFDSNKISDKLIIIGDGPLKDSLELTTEHIVYYPFMSQNEILSIMSNVKYFCLPSNSEPWGVVIHEAAAAGLPIVTTTNCGAATAFVKQGYNGYFFEPGNALKLKEILLKMNGKNQQEIHNMGKRSFELSKQIHPEMWSDVLLNL
ncbi:glycosyltransferase [Flavobacterium sp. LB1P62]|uniref:glycosyltransferase n=1 Tax=Flavobacterium sp. LB1P62 TaxID=3401715 RepID=UPI003AAA878D